ncbi:hypothetical protein S40293_09664 [Stachybotrys chartarum IBT 40293]|nr:hypothetical protein S40293_09664 [Stachybotrys chartarum IBT 40293]KFA72409.1 hypothetical protein S40288_09703 [Stachybotrys chartarum IBT 40288]
MSFADNNVTGGSDEILLVPEANYLPNFFLAKAVVCVLLPLVLWRAWKFTILPILRPDQPKEFPYWIPSLAHGRAFFLDSNGLLTRARNYLGDSKEPFSLTAFGMTFYVVTQIKHSAEVYRNSETLSFEEFVQGLMRINGNDESTIKAVYSPLPADKAGFPNPHGDSLGVLAQKMHAHQLHPGENLVTLQKLVKAWIDKHANLGDLSKFPSAVTKGSKSIEVPLYWWCSETFIQLGQDVYFGETLSKIDPDLPAAFLTFDELIWKMLYRYPSFLSTDMTTARNQVIHSLDKYFRVPQSERKGDIAWLVTAMEDEMRAIGVEKENLAVVVFHLYLAINTNTRKTAFWLLCYLIYNPSLLASFKAETAAAFGPDGELVDPFMIQDPLRCPLVDSVWHETLRMSGWAASVRLITADTVIGGKRMNKGNRVMVPHRLLHFDEGVFGPEPHAFRPERWMHKRGEDGVSSLARSPSWRPFGAGKTMCSGRFLARFSVTTFVATLLRRFDVELLGDAPFPKADEGRPVLGTMSVKEGCDVKVRITAKQ